MKTHESQKIVTLEDYELLVGAETIDRIREKAKRLQGLHMTHINSTYYGGGLRHCSTSSPASKR